jgi:hypothetical protein
MCALLLWLIAPASSLRSGTAHPVDAPRENIVLQWNTAILRAVRDSRLGPPMVARALAIVHTCMYDAWAAYDRVAMGTRLGGTIRQPPGQRTLRNQVEAISFAAYAAAVDLFPASGPSLFDPLMASLGYDDPGDAGEDPGSPAHIGTVACHAVLAFRHRDGANQLGDEPNGASGVAYSDYTGYQPVNEPLDLNRPFDASTVRDPDRWQPLRYSDNQGHQATQSFLAPYWGLVTPFAIPSGNSLRSTSGPARFGTEAYRQQALDLLDISAHLSDRRKAIVEYWADGPGTDLPPGHWNLFAQYVSHRDHHGPGRAGIAADIKLFFALNNAMLDASIVAWDDKRFYDSVRPITAVRYLFHDQAVLSWAGPYQGTKAIDGGAWLPYQRATFPTPPFAEYASGHSNFSAAAARVLRLATGSDAFGMSVKIPAGSSGIEPGAVPAHDVWLAWPTFSDAADEAGLSRRYGGIHFERGDLDARRTGRDCADMAWGLAQRYFSGTSGAGRRRKRRMAAVGLEAST